MTSKATAALSIPTWVAGKSRRASATTRAPRGAGRLDLRRELRVRRGRGRRAAAREDEALGVVLAQRAHVLDLGLRPVVGVADHHEVAHPAGHVLDAAGDLGEVGVDDVVDDHADDPAGARDERLGERAGRVAEVGRGSQHAGARRLRHRMRRPVEDARRRGHRGAGAPADVRERRHPRRVCHARESDANLDSAIPPSYCVANVVHAWLTQAPGPFGSRRRGTNAGASAARRMGREDLRRRRVPRARRRATR